MTQHHLVIQTMALSQVQAFLKDPQGCDSTTSLGSSLQCLIALFVKKFFLMTT